MIQSNPKLVAANAVKIASSLCQQIQNDRGKIEHLTKKDRSPVTLADYCSQVIIAYYLKCEFPDIPIVAEEDSSLLVDTNYLEFREEMMRLIQGVIPELSVKDVLDLIGQCQPQNCKYDRFWVLDPIDGTKGFLRGDQYAISLGLIDRGSIELGILGCPNFSLTLNSSDTSKGTLFVAEKGKGVSVEYDGHLSQLGKNSAKKKELVDAIFCESVEKGHSSHSKSQKLIQRLHVCQNPLKIDSQCKYAAIATGLADVYLRLPTKKDYREKIWDHAAGCLVVQEVGGTVTDLLGKPLDFTRGFTLENNKGILASNGGFHSKILESIEHI